MVVNPRKKKLYEKTLWVSDPVVAPDEDETDFDEIFSMYVEARECVEYEFYDYEKFLVDEAERDALHEKIIMGEL